MSEATVEIVGLEQVAANLAAVAPRFRDAAIDALLEEAANIIAVAEVNVPVASGDLRDSGAISDPTPEDNGIAIHLTFGDAKTAPYAIAVHEHPSPADPPSWRHTKSGQVVFTTGGPKFLERPVRDAQAGMLERIAARTASGVGGA